MTMIKKVELASHLNPLPPHLHLSIVQEDLPRHHHRHIRRSQLGENGAHQEEKVCRLVSPLIWCP